MRLVVTVGQMVHPDTFMGIGCMDKLAAADIDSDVGNTVLIRVFEKNQIARLEQPVWDILTVVILLGCRAREGNTVCGAENVSDEAGTVEARARSTAHDIAGTTKCIRRFDDIPAMNSVSLRLKLCNTGFVVRPGMRVTNTCREECRCAGGECRK